MGSPKHDVRPNLVLAVTFLSVSAMLTPSVEAQQSARPRTTRTQPWVVVKAPLDINAGEEEVAEFGKESDAASYADKENKKLASSAKYYFAVRKRPTLEAKTSGAPLEQPKNPSPIQKPDLKFVDPGAPGSSKKSSNLPGTRWKGTEGGQPVTFQFEAGGQVKAFDKMGEWKGTWKAISDSRIVIELTQPNRINYSGALSGNRLSGVARNTATGQQWEWEASLNTDQPPVIGDAKGTWNGIGNASGYMVKFEPGGTGYRAFGDPFENGGSPSRFTWIQSGSQVEVTYTRGGNKTSFNLKNDTLTEVDGMAFRKLR